VLLCHLVLDGQSITVLDITRFDLSLEDIGDGYLSKSGATCFSLRNHAMLISSREVAVNR
jgi:hypothetical protein